MATVNPNFTFDGNCEEAFNFYKSVFGGEFSYIGRYREMPSCELMPESDLNKIMHISLPISAETVLMGADAVTAFGGTKTMGNNVSISINASSEAEAKSIFEALSVGGTVLMPLELSFWGALFGVFTDKFGIEWMVNYDYNKK